MCKVLKTKRLDIRPYEDADQTAMIELLTNQEIKESFMIPDFQTKEEAISMFKKIQAFAYSDAHYDRGIYLNQQLIGFVNDVEIGDGIIELGYVIHPAHKNMGYATEMLRAVIDELFSKGFRQIVAGAFENNAASIQVMKKCGMAKIEKEDDICYHGGLHHCYYYAIFKDHKMIKTIQRLDEVMDFAWELSENNLYASYPRINSIEELKEEFENAINFENRNIIAYYHQNVLCGVCVYFWISDEKYAQTSGFLIRGDYGQIADEFISHISKQLPGYELFIGVPFTNNNANEYFKEKNIECIEDSIVTRICNLEPHTNERNACIEQINKSNFEEYAVFHDKYTIPAGIYYNSKNLQKTIERFRIFAFRQDGAIHGSIFVKADKDLSDVIGLFLDEEYKNKGIESILINEMLTQLYNEFGEIKEILYFIDEDSTDELNLALAAGFEIKEKYRLYKCIL